MDSSSADNLLYHEIHTNPKSGEWLLMIHGAGGSTRTWKRQIEELSSHFNLLIIDLPGHGQSANMKDPEPEYTFDSISKTIWKVVDHHNIDKVHVLGVSLGAIIALNIETQFADRIKSLVLAGPIVQLNLKLKIIASLSLTSAKVIGYHSFYKIAARIVMPRQNHKTSRGVFIRESKFLTVDEFKKWTGLYKNLNATLLYLFSAATDIPRLLLVGDQDHLFLKPAQAYSKTMPHSVIEIVPKCGHVVNIERADAFNESCVRFVKKMV